MLKKFLPVLILLHISLYAQTEVLTINLGDAISLGIKSNPMLRAAREKRSASEARRLSSISLPQPELKVSYEGAPLHAPLRLAGEKTIGLSQAFEFPTNYFIRNARSAFDVMNAEYEYLDTERKLTSLIKNSYYKSLVKHKQLGNMEEALSIAEDFLVKVRIRHEVGEAASLELLNARVQLTEARNNLQLARNELQNSLEELKFHLGFSINKETRLVLIDSLKFLNTQLDLTELLQTALENNPQIKIAENECSSAETDKTLAWSTLLPNFSISCFKQTIDGNDKYYGAELGISLPLWFMFDQRGQIEQASANKKIAESDLQLLKNQICLQVKTAYSDYLNNMNQVRLYIDEILPQTAEVFRVAAKSYDAGELSYVEFLQARQTRIGALTSYNTAMLNYYSSLFSLEETVGKELMKKGE